MSQKRIERPKSDIETKDGPIRTTTEFKVKEIAKMLSNGKSKTTILDTIEERYGLSPYSGRDDGVKELQGSDKGHSRIE